MAKKFMPQIKKLQTAINTKIPEKIIINKTQIYSESNERINELIIVKKAVYDPDKGKTKYIELFHSTSDVQIVLYLRDFWYEINGWEVPTDNEQWNETKKRYKEKHGES